MNHLPTEEEDKGFQEGRAVAEYLETHTCAHSLSGACHIVCSDCIAAAVNAVHEAFSRDAEKNADELRTRTFDIGGKKWPI